MINLEITGLNARQQVLADIMWQLEEYEQVEAFIATLPDRESCECQSIIELMRMAIVEQVAPTVIDGKPNFDMAQQVLQKYNI
jgi:hypothetical protein